MDDLTHTTDVETQTNSKTEFSQSDVEQPVLRQGRRCCERGQGGRGGGGGAFIEPAVLAALLSQDISYGYDLRKRIIEISDGSIDVDVGGLYRILRRLEADGFVVSSWCEEGSGPRRRDYEITAEGVALAEQWLSTLRQREVLTGLLASLLERGFSLYDSSVDKNGS